MATVDHLTLDNALAELIDRLRSRLFAADAIVAVVAAGLSEDRMDAERATALREACEILNNVAGTLEPLEFEAALANLRATSEAA